MEGARRRVYPTISELREMFTYEPKTGIFRWRHGHSKAAKGSIAGGRHRLGYVQICVRRNAYLAHRLAWLFHYGVWPDLHIDHKDGDKTNNAISNLRIATRSQNGANQKRSIANKSGYKGVYWCKTKRKWRAAIWVHGKNIKLGRYKDPESAHAAYVEAAKAAFGDFARFE